MTFGLFLAAKQDFFPFLWGAAFVCSLASTFFSRFFYKADFDTNLGAMAMTLPLFTFSLTSASRAVIGESPQTRALLRLTIATLLFALVIVQVIDSHSASAYDQGMRNFLGYLFATLSFFIILIHNEYRRVQKRLLISGLLVFLFTFHAPSFGLVNKLAYSVLSISILGIAALFLATLKLRKYFNYMLFLIGLQFLALYFRAFGGMAKTGFGLIVSGIFLILITMWWKKNKDAMAARIEGWME